MSKEQVRANFMKVLKRRFTQGKTVPGTRDYHSFTPISNTSFEARPYTLQSVGTVIEFDGVRTHDVSINECVAVKVNQTVEIGIVRGLDAGDIIVQFFKISLSNNNLSLTWPLYPRNQNVIPSDICFKLAAPKPTTKSGRSYNILPHDYKKFKQCING